MPHGYRKSFSLMGKVKSCLIKVLAKLSLLIRERKQKLIISFHTQYFNYLNFFTGKVLFSGYNLIFEVFPSILTAIIHKLGEMLKFIPLVSLWSNIYIYTTSYL